MNTLDLHQAAAFLKMHPDTVQRRARRGLIPSAKPGKSWVFIENDLADWLRSQYRDEAKPCQSSSLTIPRIGGSTFGTTDTELDALLARPAKLKHKKSMTT
ncbi:MAG: helix-turn-helix domain-containing protein [Rhodocyclaceae bacterium]|nr:helix-turn-helix domain-containing protein [Rhodocyclaceae bacterium]